MWRFASAARAPRLSGSARSISRRSSGVSSTSAVPIGDPAQQFEEGEVRLSRLWIRQPRDRVAQVVGGELGLLVDRARQQAPAERTEGDEPDAELLERREDLLLGLAPPERVLRLERRYGLHRLCTADRPYARLRDPEVAHLALLDQFLDGTGDLPDRNGGVDRGRLRVCVTSSACPCSAAVQANGLANE
jgi:hypothetical protein